MVILQGSGRYPELMRGYVQSAISLLAGRINSPEIGESKTRRMWLVLDEFPQLGKLNGVASILEVGRTKGFVWSWVRRIWHKFKTSMVSTSGEPGVR